MAFYSKRIVKLIKFFLIMGLLLVMRLVYLQLIIGNDLTIAALRCRSEEVAMEHGRGQIFDRNGIPLTDSSWQFCIVIFPGQVSNMEKTINALNKYVSNPTELISENMKNNSRTIKLSVAIDASQAHNINAQKLPGVVAIPEKKRYDNNALAKHVTGYINQVDNYGVTGIEYAYDDILQGTQPEMVAALVDAGQRIIPGLGYKRLHLYDDKRHNIVLTLNSKIQECVESVLDKRQVKGAVVVIDPATGEILAMASRPDFDANRIDEYLKKESAPLLNRAVVSYQPGSVFKLVIAAAALEKGNISPSTVFLDQGYIDVGNRQFKGWDFEQGGHGKITFSEALAYSSNPVFIKIGLELQAPYLISYAKKMGFGQKTGLNIDGEAAGILPDPATLYQGELANLSLGQGECEATPLQVAVLVACIANDGIKNQPLLVKRITNKDGKVIKEFRSTGSVRVIPTVVVRQLQDMMAGVTRYGTGQAANIGGYGSAGKTGSAETGRKDGAGRGVNHAWFAGYTPLEHPKYAAVVFVEDGMSGGDVAAPIFREIMTEILKRRL